MKGAILRLVVVVLFAAIGGFAAQADDYYANFGAPIAGASFCNEELARIGTHYEWNLPEDGRMYIGYFINGNYGEIDSSQTGYRHDYLWLYGVPFSSTPYYFRAVVIVYSDSGQMQSRAVAYNLYCDVNSQAHLSMDILY